VGFGSPIPSEGSEFSSGISSALSGFSPERKRNHTINNTHHLYSYTVPSAISPKIISDVKAAISFRNGGNSGSPTPSLQSQFKASHAHGGHKNDNINPHHHGILTAISSKDDIRRRAITEPNRSRLLSPQNSQKPKGLSKRKLCFNLPIYTPLLIKNANITIVTIV
jgi:hypothetical protein